MSSNDEIIATLRGADRVLIVTHVYPDGDALGSQLALGQVLSAMGKEVILYGEEKISHLYEFLPGGGAIHTTLPEAGEIDCAVALDCGDQLRLGREMDKILAMIPLVVIDHHAGHKNFGTLRWIDPGSAATAEMLYELIAAMGAPLPFDAAYNLYAALVADTGSFKYASTTARTFRVAGELLARGINPEKIAGKLFDNYSVNRLLLLKTVLDTLELHADNRVALIHVTLPMFAATGALPEDTETFINLPRAISTVKVAAFLKETKNGVLGISMRSKGDRYDVAAIARRFGGGGHRNAAGFKVADTTIEEGRRLLLDALLPLFADG